MKKKKRSKSLNPPDPPDLANDIRRVRELIDFERPDVVAIRNDVARLIWERSLRPDLIDRIVAGIVLQIPGVTLLDLKSVNRAAENETINYEKSSGRFGKMSRWRTITLWIKSAYESAGWHWFPTRQGYEPKPVRDPVPVEHCQSRCQRASSLGSSPVPIPDGFTVDDLAIPFVQFVAKVKRSLQVDPSDARAKAFDLRNELRLAAKKQ